jgi:signal transduction histidine kinase
VIGFAKILRDSSDVKEQLETLSNQLKVLADSNQHKTLFLARLSHEMRNPLSALSTTLELVKNGPPADVLPDAAGIFERQLNHLYRLADDLLDVTRISTGKVSIQFQLLDIKEPIATAIETVQPLIAQKRHRLVQHILQTPMTVQADRTRLEQVFINLLTNAARYTRDGGNIEVRASSDQKEAFVHVIDDGIGIPPDILPNVFELFTRGDSAEAYAKDGLGIGLSLVKELIQTHGGTVQVRSDGIGKGSEFTVRLPLADPGNPMSGNTTSAT